MSQKFEDIAVTEIMYDSLSKILERDKTGLTLGAGTEFPQELEDWMIGRVCLRTDLKTLYMLESINPVSWKEMINFSQELATKSYVDANFQPLNQNLTALSAITPKTDTIPYFNSPTTMGTLPVTGYMEQWMNVADADAAKKLLGLGKMAEKDIVTADDIKDKSITPAKLTFTPITAGEGYTTGDIKESYSPDDEDGFITLKDGITIGDASSGATYKGDKYSALYVKIWSSSAVSVQNGKGSTATQDWSGHKKMTLPQGLSYLNPNCYYRIKL